MRELHVKNFAERYQYERADHRPGDGPDSPKQRNDKCSRRNEQPEDRFGGDDQLHDRVGAPATELE